MATEYTRIYSYASQTSWTKGTRTIPLSKFTVSGDTEQPIGYIRSIAYKHRCNAYKDKTYELIGRFVLNDGTVIDSAPVLQDIKSYKVVLVTNVWEQMPTAEQWAMIRDVQVVDGATGSAKGDGNFTWATPRGYPAQIIVTYSDEPPVTYAPKIDTFDVRRMNADGILADDGSYIATTLKLSASADAPLDAAKLTLYISEKAEIDSTAQTVDLSARIPELISGLNMNTTLIPGEYSPGANWYFAIEFSIGDETALAADMVQRSFVTMHQSKCLSGGVAIGMYSTATEGNPKFETAHRAYFYGGVEGVGFDSSYDEVEYAGRDPDGRRRYIREMVYALGSTGDTNYYSEKIAENIHHAYILYGSLTRSSDGKVFPANFFRNTSARIDTSISDDGRVVSQGSANMAGEMRVTVLYTKA